MKQKSVLFMPPQVKDDSTHPRPSRMRYSRQREVAGKPVEELVHAKNYKYSVSNDRVLSIQIYQTTLTVTMADEYKTFALLGNKMARPGKKLLKEYENTVAYVFPDKQPFKSPVLNTTTQ